MYIFEFFFRRHKTFIKLKITFNLVFSLLITHLISSVSSGTTELLAVQVLHKMQGSDSLIEIKDSIAIHIYLDTVGHAVKKIDESDKRSFFKLPNCLNNCRAAKSPIPPNPSIPTA